MSRSVCHETGETERRRVAPRSGHDAISGFEPHDTKEAGGSV
jgi:hypothetical protein